MFVPDDIVVEIKSRATLIDVIGNYVTLKRIGHEWTGECPFCNEKHFSLSEAKQIYKCWHCEVGGNNPIGFLMKKENLDYPAALKWLADFYRIFIPETPNVPLKVGSNNGKENIQKPDQQSQGHSSFLQETLYQTGLTAARNHVYLKWQNKPAPEKIPLIGQDADGNLEFMVYDINGFVVTNQRQRNGVTVEEPYKVLRLMNPVADKKGVMKYRIPKGCGTRPYFPPALLDKFQQKTAIETLYITEGYKKAIAGWIAGIDIVGLSSISTYREKDTLQLHRDIVELILTCQVKNVVLLYDGDCRNISLKALESETDIYQRPSNFFGSARGIKELLKDYLKDYEISLYFAHINSDSVEGNPKGLDDIYSALSQSHYKEEVLENDTPFQKGRKLVAARNLAYGLLNSDLRAFSRPGLFFTKLNITFGFQKLLSHLAIDSVNSFYHFHQDVIKDKAFVYAGTQYRYNSEKSECEIVIPAASKAYVRVGDDYYEKVKVPNKYKDLEEQLHRRIKTTISDDHGKSFFNHVKKFKAFCNVPDHVNYMDVIHNCYNMYSKFEWEPEQGPCDATLEFLEHIFEEHYQLGLDYVQLLYQRPTQILPILCLVSRENSTGKSTFAKWLKAIFKQNMSIVGNAELGSDFNGAYATRLVTCCDEAFIDKRVTIEKVKSLSTADRITLNQKGRDHVEIEFFGKFILLSNNEDNFIYANEDDIRYWVRKIRKPAAERVTFLNDMISEIPAFLHYLNKRTMSTTIESRMWFHPRLLVTDALRRVIAHSRPMIEKELRIRLENIFKDFAENIVYMTLGDVRKELLNNRFEEKYIDSVLRENLRVDNYWEPDPTDITKRIYKVKRYSYPKWHTAYVEGHPETSRADFKSTGRPFVFLRPDFINQDLEKSIQHDPEMLALAQPVPPHYIRPGMLNLNLRSEIPF